MEFDITCASCGKQFRIKARHISFAKCPYCGAVREGTPQEKAAADVLADFADELDQKFFGK